MLGFVVVALGITAWLRHSRFGAQLQAVRDNEDAARAIGVDPYRTKLLATIASAALMGAAGAFYVQVFQYIDPAIAFGPHVSVEALVGAIVGGMGTLWGPVLGAAVLHALGRSHAQPVRHLAGLEPGDLRRGAGGDRDVHAARPGRARAARCGPVGHEAAVADTLLRTVRRVDRIRRPARGAGREPAPGRPARWAR